MTRLVETFGGMVIAETTLQEHPGHGNQKVHGRRIGGIVDTTISQGGFSANWIGHQPRSGFMVGGVVTPVKSAKKVADYSDARAELKVEVKAFIQQHRETLKKPGHYLGTWVDDDGHVVLDVSQRMSTRGGALRRASVRGEDAVYDVRGGKSVYTPKGGPTADERSLEQAQSDLSQAMSTAIPLAGG